MADDEQALIHAARRGDMDAFNGLVLRYQNNVYNLTYRIMGDGQSAADATQEAFITAFRRLNTFRDGSFKAWLLRIATNTCYDELRRQKRRPVTSVEDLPGADTDDGAPVPDASDTPEQVVQGRELQRAIQECINALSPDQRMVLVLCDIEEMSYEEIAVNINANLGTVKSRLSRARVSVRNCLQAFRELLPPSYRFTE